MINLTIHTYGYIDAMYYVLNGIAMLTNGPFSDMLIKTMCLLSTCYYGLKMAYSGSSGQYKQHLASVFGMLLLVNVALLQKTSMIIQDHVTKQRITVDNLLYGFAVPVGLMESFGDLLTIGFEQAFQVQNSTSSNYRDYGMVFGARLIQESRNWRINNPEFIENMDNFLRRCVIREAMIGTKYTPQDLLISNDIWTLVRPNMSHLRQVPMRVNNDRQLMTCAAAVPVIEGAFRAEIFSLGEKYQNSQFASASNSQLYTPLGLRGRLGEIFGLGANIGLNRNIQNAFGSNIGANQTAETLIRQQMMINSLHNFSDDYGFARASATQESSWRLSGDLSTIYLPMLLTVMKSIFYASFVFLVPMMLLSGGMGKYMSYLSIVASLQLWPALNSVLNMFIDLYSAPTLAAISSNVISFSTASKVGDFTDKIVAVASGLQMTVPFLAFGIIQGGVGGFMNIANTITGASQAAATSVAHEVTTGNRSLDNRSIGNMQMAMQSGFKTDFNSSYASGASSHQHMDGSQEKVLGDGSMLMQSGAGMTTSGGAVRVNFREDAGIQVANAASVNQSLLEGDQKSFSIAERETFAKTSNFIQQLAKREHAGETIDYSKMGEQGKAVQMAVSHTKNLAANENYNWDQSADASVKASIDGSLGVKTNGSGASMGSGVDVSVGARNYNMQQVSDNQQSGTDSNYQVKYDDIVRGSSSEQFARSNNIDTSVSDDLRQSYEKQKSLESSISLRSEKAEQYSETLSKLESSNMSMDRDNYHQLQDKIASQYGVSGQEAHRMIETNDPRAMGTYRGMVNQFTSGSNTQLQHAKQEVSSGAYQEKAKTFEIEHGGKIDSNPEAKIKQHAQNQGFGTTDAGEFMQNDTKSKVDGLMQENSDQIQATKRANDIEYQKASLEAKKYEENSKYVRMVIGRPKN